MDRTHVWLDLKFSLFYLCGSRSIDKYTSNFQANKIALQLEI